MILRQHLAVALDMNTIWFGFHGHKRKLNINELNIWNYDIPNENLDSDKLHDLHNSIKV